MIVIMIMFGEFAVKHLLLFAEKEGVSRPHYFF